MSLILETRGLSRIFSLPRAGFGKERAVRRAVVDVNLKVEEGARLGIVGESGSGKTTLAKLLLGLDTPSEGEVRFRGQAIPLADMHSFRRQVQVVFQDPRSSLNPRMRVGDIVREPLECLNVTEDHDTRIIEGITEVGLPKDLVQRFPHELSGGQRQRVAIARALAPRPKVLIADEPVSALDVLVRDEILSLLADLTTNLGLTLILISHDLSVVARLCDDVVVMQHGTAVEKGKTMDVFRAPRHEFTKRLITAVPRLPGTK